MLDVSQVREFVVRPALQHIGLWSLAAEELVLGTGLQESRLRYIKQLGRGPALGLFQMEPATHDDIWFNYLRYQIELRNLVKGLAPHTHKFHPTAEALIGHLPYAAAMCRVHYRRVRAPLPAAGDIEGQAKYWKRYYNTELGKGTVEEYMRSAAPVFA